MGKVYKEINEGRQCDDLFIDLMKAFDTVDHATLLVRLQEAGEWWGVCHYGGFPFISVAGPIGLDWVDFWASKELSHKDLVSLDHYSWCNNLCNGRFKGKLPIANCFADDTALFDKTESIECLKVIMQYDVNALNSWFMKNFKIMCTTYFFVFVKPQS